MLFPYKDDTPFKKVPIVTFLIIAINIYVFIHMHLFYQGGKGLFVRYGAIPSAIFSNATEQPFHILATVFFSLFMHSGFLHLFVNMYYLWLFSHKIEDELGPLRFFLFYLFSGFCAVLIYALTASTSIRPLVGASGAVSGVIGAYILLFPQAKVHSILFLAVYVKRIAIPAFLIIGAWASLQFYGGIVSVLLMKNSNTAWFAHLGGFLIGLSSIRLWMPHREEQVSYDQD
jgi:membrane associated rhomboid family serine protease